MDSNGSMGYLLMDISFFFFLLNTIVSSVRRVESGENGDIQSFPCVQTEWEGSGRNVRKREGERARERESERERKRERERERERESERARERESERERERFSFFFRAFLLLAASAEPNRRYQIFNVEKSPTNHELRRRFFL